MRYPISRWRFVKFPGSGYQERAATLATPRGLQERWEYFRPARATARSPCRAQKGRINHEPVPARDCEFFSEIQRFTPLLRCATEDGDGSNFRQCSYALALEADLALRRAKATEARRPQAVATPGGPVGLRQYLAPQARSGNGLTQCFETRSRLVGLLRLSVRQIYKRLAPAEADCDRRRSETELISPSGGRRLCGVPNRELLSE